MLKVCLGGCQFTLEQILELCHHVADQMHNIHGEGKSRKNGKMILQWKDVGVHFLRFLFLQVVGNEIGEGFFCC